MNRIPGMAMDFGQIMNLGMTVMARGNAVGCFCVKDLAGLGLSKGPALLLKPGLEISAAASAAEVAGFVGCHINKILFSHNRPDNIS